MMNRIRAFMCGRYGSDSMSMTLSSVGIVVMVISQLTRWWILYYLGFALMLYAFVRIFSKNISKRSEENRRFGILIAPIQGWFLKKISEIQDSKTHRRLKCPSCSQKIRVPRGRGSILITCPACHQEFIKKV